MKKTIFTISSFLMILTNIMAQTTPQIKVTVGTKVYIANTYDNASAKAFIGLLPLTIQMNELNGNEKYSYLSSNLPSAATNPGTIQTGDLMLWGDNCLVLFYKTFSTGYNYTKLGYIINSSGLSETVSSGNITVNYELNNETTEISNPKEDTFCFFNRNKTIEVPVDCREFTLYTANGVLIKKENTNIMNLNAVPSGIYMIKAIVGQKEMVRKLMLQ
ncbi:MAG: cyclophilin-like fold protein [Paludibacter sp.]